jgi:hypothetical protein
MARTINKERAESYVKKKVNEYLNSLGEGVFFPYNPYGGTPGVPDKVGCLRGRFIGIECKRPEKKRHKDGGLSPGQKAFKRRIEQNDGVYIVAYSVLDVEEAFKEYGLLL